MGRGLVRLDRIGADAQLLGLGPVEDIDVPQPYASRSPVSSPDSASVSGNPETPRTEAERAC